MLKIIHNNISKMQKNISRKENIKRKKTLQLKEKNKVYLLTKNLQLFKEYSRKLNHIKIKSFFIKTQKKLMNFKLNLLYNIKIHKMFHISLLKSINLNTFI